MTNPNSPPREVVSLDTFVERQVTRKIDPILNLRDEVRATAKQYYDRGRIEEASDFTSIAISLELIASTIKEGK